jgi:hypothetical protein
MTNSYRRISDTQLGTAYELVSTFSGATEAQRVLMTLWAAHTHTYRSFSVTPRIDFAADGPGCGKTVNMQVVAALSHNSIICGYASQASVYSYLDEHPETTIALDEVDKVFGTNGRKTSRAILAAVINDGYTSKGKVMVMRNGKSVFVPVFVPMLLAGIGSLPEDTADRCLIIALEKCAPPTMYLPELYEDDLNFIGAEIAEFMNQKHVQEQLAATPPLADVPGSPRFRQIMAPLAAIAELVGITEQFKAAITEVQTGITEEPPTPVHMLMLADVRESWPVDAELLRGAEVIKALHSHKSRRWDKISASRVGEIAVAGMFRESGIETSVRNGERGYTRADVFAGSEVQS